MLIHPGIQLLRFRRFLPKSECEKIMNHNSPRELYKRTRSIQHGETNKLTSNCKMLRTEVELEKKMWYAGVDAIAEAHDVSYHDSKPIMLLKYEEGQYATKHLDALTPQEVVECNMRTQHLYSFVLYLNDDYEGGELRFDKLGIEIKPKAGDAYMWKNVLEETEGGYYIPDENSLHRSLPIQSGTKYNIVKFFA